MPNLSQGAHDRDIKQPLVFTIDNTILQSGGDEIVTKWRTPDVESINLSAFGIINETGGLVSGLHAEVYDVTNSSQVQITEAKRAPSTKSLNTQNDYIFRIKNTTSNQHYASAYFEVIVHA